MQKPGTRNNKITKTYTAQIAEVEQEKHVETR